MSTCGCTYEADELACRCARRVGDGLGPACVSCRSGIHVMLPPDASATDIANAHAHRRRAEDFPEIA